MPRGRPAFSFLLIDLPSDHEIDNSLSTECQIIGAILHNRRFGSISKTVRTTTVEGFNELPWRPYPKVGFVHLAAHGGKRGIGLIGGEASWSTVAQALRKAAPALGRDQKRVLTLSCCYSGNAYNALKPLLSNHFTGAYHFHEKKIGFAKAMTVWAMFYHRKIIDRPLIKVVEPINEFFGDDVIVYRSF